MEILHGTWIPLATDDFVQGGRFCLWAETTEPLIHEEPPKGSKAAKSKLPPILQPYHLTQDEVMELLVGLGFKTLEPVSSPQYFLLPSAEGQPLPSLELARYLETELPEKFDWQYWPIECCSTTARVQGESVNTVIKLLNELHFMALYNLAEVQLGSDLLFWYHYTQFFKQIIFKDQYIPALRYRELAATIPKGRGKKAAAASPGFETYGGWEIVSEQYETELQRYVEWMPLACVSGFTEEPKQTKVYDKERLLRHFSECLITQIVSKTPLPSVFENKVFDSLIQISRKQIKGSSRLDWEQYQQWQTWRDRITRNQTAELFYLGFQLQAPAKPTGEWLLEFQVSPRNDPSTRIGLADYWRSRDKARKQFQKQLGANFEQHLLTNLGYAARIYPKLWSGMETDEPMKVGLTTDEAFNFLNEAAWVLEDAGCKVSVPAWWTPQGRQRMKIRLKAKSSGAKSAQVKNKGYFSRESLVKYQYELAIGGERVSEQEWQHLLKSKTPLVQFRGQWIELDKDKMQEMLEFWKKQQQENPELTLADFMKVTAEGEASEELEIEHDDALADMLDKLNDQTKLEAIADPDGFQGKLREYQKRGVAWLGYLERLGLNGCLADDMGLGKSAQVIARLLQEREGDQPQQSAKSTAKSATQSTAKSATKSVTRSTAKSTAKSTTQSETPSVLPTLLIAPTSVLGNWQKEIEKFAPQLRSHVHHGNQRSQTVQEFQAEVQGCDVFITSFTLVRKDEKLFNSMDWHRLVVDEAQNIKNPKAAQTKAILKLPATHRLALTGTPVENRLLDLWSIFNFLNPGYLGKEAQFRQSFEIPIQKNGDRARSATLKKLVEPFILRRVKTDQSIIQDLPDKVEQKLYCNLTKEQAALYEAIVKEVEKDIETVDGIQRKGMILATLLKLKQICNHPRQFLQDDSDFTTERSHKLERLVEMIEEVKAEGESLLVFTQFTEIGEALEKYIRHTLHYNTYYIHGGTSRQKRERMISEFQDPETEPSVFILSLKAGGVGITLTKANHVFHFDRWWNPAVEDQATDRAFRIGQKKNVFVHKFVAIGTLEEKIDQMIEDKKKLAGAIVGADESWLTELDNNAFKKLIQLNRNAVL
jgi:SNF2 family DNA or RNA helicase